MKTVLLRLVLAAVMAAGAWLSWSEARRAEQRADAAEQVATLRFSDVNRDVDAATTATVAYWLGQYASVTGDTGDTTVDAYVLRTAANAAFRQSQREMTEAGSRDPGAGQRDVQRLDSVLQAYASALKASARDVEAAYNYEYVARLRDQIARAPQAKLQKPAPAVAAKTGDLPLGPTIHGAPGMPPPDAKMEDLEMMAPMDYGDRETQPLATPGARRERKG